MKPFTRITLSWIILLTCHASSLPGQTVDSNKYWHQKYDSAAYKVIAAREVIWNMQDYINLCKKNPKLNVFDKSWVQRVILDIYYTKSGWKPSNRHKVIHKTSTKK